MKYTKRPFRLPEQVDKLENRGLLFNNREEAERFLFDVSYYRLRAYTYPFQDNSECGNHKFIREDINFNDIKDIYVFDRDLRSIVFNAIARIEVSVRTRMIQIYSESINDGHWFLNSELYRFVNCPDNPYDYDKIIKDVTTDVARSNEDFIKHYNQKYGNPKLPPCWMSLEVVSMGTLSRLYQSLKKDINKKKLANSYGITDVNIFENWLHAISNLRNSCAHHSRIWNRRFMVNIKIPYKTTCPFIRKENLDIIKQNKLFVLLSCIKYLLDSIDSSNNFKALLFQLLNRNVKLLSLRDMGFPDKWKQFPIWQ